MNRQISKLKFSYDQYINLEKNGCPRNIYLIDILNGTIKSKLYGYTFIK